MRVYLSGCGCALIWVRLREEKSVAVSLNKNRKVYPSLSVVDSLLTQRLDVFEVFFFLLKISAP